MAVVGGDKMSGFVDGVPLACIVACGLALDLHRHGQVRSWSAALVASIASVIVVLGVSHATFLVCLGVLLYGVRRDPRLFYYIAVWCVLIIAALRPYMLE